MWSRLVIAAGLISILGFQASAAKPVRNCAEALVYVTDHPQQLQRTLDARSHLYDANLRREWKDARAEFTFTETGEEILKIRGLEVMRGFEKPYMASIARTAASRGGKVLNVGYGIGFIDSEIERLRNEFGITEHHIIELNVEVAQRALRWRDSQPNREDIFIHQGDWKEVMAPLVKAGVIFDAIAYDAFPLEKQELHRDFVPFLEEALRLKAVREETGLLTFYMDSSDGFGSRFTQYSEGLGVGRMSLERVSVTLPPGGNQYWERDFFFTPTLTGISYRK